IAAAAGCGGCATRRARRRPPMHCSGQRDAVPSRARLRAPPSEPRHLHSTSTASPSASAWQRGSPSPSLGGGPFSPSPPPRLTAARDAPMRPLPVVCAIGGSCARSGPRARRAIEGTPRSAQAPPRCAASARRACLSGGAPVSAAALRSLAQPTRCARSRAGAARCESVRASDQPFARGGHWAHCAAPARTCARWLPFAHLAAGGGGARVRSSCEAGSRRAEGGTHAAAACARSRERGRSQADPLGLDYEINDA
ncbi:hypothetical protein T492DRAFT_1053448, partial [Pavlovales sp. CCMP2436]